MNSGWTFLLSPGDIIKMGGQFSLMVLPCSMPLWQSQRLPWLEIGKKIKKSSPCSVEVIQVTMSRHVLILRLDNFHKICQNTWDSIHTLSCFNTEFLLIQTLKQNRSFVNTLNYLDKTFCIPNSGTMWMMLWIRDIEHLNHCTWLLKVLRSWVFTFHMDKS